MAFFFGKGHDFDAERQTLGLLVQLLHAGHGHKDAQAPVVLAAVAHRVVMAARHQVFAACGGRVVAAHHVAHRVGINLVKTAVAHVLGDALGAGAVRVGEIRHRQLASFCKTRVGVLGQLFLPIPDLVAERGLHVKLVVHADFGDAVDVAQTLLQLHVGVTEKAALEGIDDLFFTQAQATRAAHGQDERPSKFGVVVGVELLDLVEFFGRAVGQARLGLFVGRFGRQGLADHGLARQLRVCADQVQLRFAPGVRQQFAHGVLEVCQ